MSAIGVPCSCPAEIWDGVWDEQRSSTPLVPRPA